MDIDESDGTSSDESAQEVTGTRRDTITVDGLMLVQGDAGDGYEPPFVVYLPTSHEEQLALATKQSAEEAEERQIAIDEELRLLKTALSNEGLFLHDLPNSRTGDCYFFSLAHFYRHADPSSRIPEFSQDSSITPQALRKFIVGYMELNPNMPFTKQIEDDSFTQPLHAWFQEGKWENYTQSMAKPGFFADDMVIAAASNCLHLYQRVYWNDESETVKHETKNKRNLIECKVAVTLVEKHYYVVSANEEL